MIRRVVAVVVAVAVLALSGCAQSYDGVLWRQMDSAEGGFVARITTLRETGATRADAVAALKRDTYWDGGAVPASLGPTAAAVLTHGYRWEPGDASYAEEVVLVLDVFASSGLRDEAPLHGDVGTSAVMAYDGPPAVYTCFSVRIHFLDDRLASWYRPWDDSEQSCPNVLVDRLDDGAQYVPIHEFDG
ncbi:hypothetical protein QE374_003004 [Microbacterium sp. SORGH_AS428]|uniref:hypothetical protein n=1 Tax=Microbacterium sp. SORGH_AS_0428 TaxID=3041788 RepID=UPI00285A444E|nr:hypothetical protein [Microbacterium sp. SORGH_AS_0428]MDR6201095.1 hypothetical protein [Microbacterium sp. SORGH_AS_0428]